MKKLLPFLIFLLAGIAHAQVTVRGTVTSEADGLGIPGVTIQVKDAGSGSPLM